MVEQCSHSPHRRPVVDVVVAPWSSSLPLVLLLLRRRSPFPLPSSFDHALLAPLEDEDHRHFA